MQTARTTQGAARVGRELHDAHIDFERRFDELRARAYADDWRDLDAAWGALARDLESHFAFEEEVVFPLYAQQSLDCRVLTRRLVAEHAALRELIAELGVQLQLHVLRARTIEVFVDLLQEHAAVENAGIYPWLDFEGRAGVAQRTTAQ